MPRHASSLRLVLEEIIPVLIDYTFSKMQAVRGERANHIPPHLCELIEGPEVT